MIILGWIGSILLSICAIPEVINAFLQKKTFLSWSFLLIWGGGELFTLIPVVQLGISYLILNYSINLICILILIYYKVRYK